MNVKMVGAAAAVVVGLVGAYAVQTRSDLSASERRLAELRTENEELSAVYAALSADIDALRREVGDLVDSLESLRGERGGLVRRLEELRAQLEDAQSGSVPVGCGDVVDVGAGVSQVTAQGVDCSTALAVGRSWQESCFFRRCDETEPINGYLCHIENVAPELVQVTCTDPSGRIVRFEAGS